LKSQWGGEKCRARFSGKVIKGKLKPERSEVRVGRMTKDGAEEVKTLRPLSTETEREIERERTVYQFITDELDTTGNKEPEI